MTNCKLCGAPLTKGNIKVLRKPGKRTVRVCRTCPQARSEAIRPTVSEAIQNNQGERTAKVPGTVVQRPQDATDGPLTSEVVYLDSDPPRYRFFMTRDQADKVKASVERNAAFGFGLAFEVIPVPEHLVEADPDRYADLVEVTLNGYNGGDE